jgi:hypothetical protein
VAGRLPYGPRDELITAAVAAALDALRAGGSTIERRELDEAEAASYLVALPAVILTSLQPALPPGATPAATPTLPLGQHDLLTGGRDEPSFMTTLASELPSADSVDAIVAFVKWSGLRLLLEPLEDLLWRKVPVRLLTTTYIGVTERRAVDWLAERGAQVSVSYDDRTTRLHAKAWLLHRDTGFSTAFVGVVEPVGTGPARRHGVERPRVGNRRA